MEFVVIGEAESAAVKVAIMVKAQTSAHAHFMATGSYTRKAGGEGGRNRLDSKDVKMFV
jgi:hypothetical protein